MQAETETEESVGFVAIIFIIGGISILRRGATTMVAIKVTQ